MLKNIKSMINQKKDFLEAAEIILEDEMNHNIDDAIILGEDELITEDDDHEYEDHEDDKDEKDESEEDKSEGNEEQEDSDDIMDEPIDDESPVNNSEDDNIMNAPVTDGPIDEPVNEPVSEPNSDPVMSQEPVAPAVNGDELPEPVSNVTGEPVADDDILSMEIDLGTNTPKDVLPIPPANAGDAVVTDDMMDQRIDSGFGGNNIAVSDTPIENTAMANPELVDDLLNEAITIADPAEGDSSSEGAPAEETPVEEPVTDGTEDPSSEEEPVEDNEVTAAVKDKVAEAESPAYEGDPEKAKEALMDKLGKITKSLEDAKKAVMSAI